MQNICTKLSLCLIIMVSFSQMVNASEAAVESVIASMVGEIELLKQSEAALSKLMGQRTLTEEEELQLIGFREKIDSLEKTMSELITQIAELPLSIEEIVREHSSPGFDEQNQSTVTRTYLSGQEIPVPFQGISLPALAHNVTIHIVPAMQQARSEQYHSNYCGYYAIYNAISFAKNAISLIKYEFNAPIFAAGSVDPKQNRNHFAKIFPLWLNTIEKYREKSKTLITEQNKNLSQISDEEILEILKPIRVPLDFVPMPTFMQQTSLTQLADILPEQYRPLYLYSQQNGPISISIIGSSNSYDGHWFALRADKDRDGNLTLYIADSLHTPQWYDDYKIITRILPYAYILMNSLDDNTKAQFNKIK